MPGVLWPVACALCEIALYPFEHTTTPTGGCVPRSTLIYELASTSTGSTVLSLVLGLVGYSLPYAALVAGSGEPYCRVTTVS